MLFHLRRKVQAHPDPVDITKPVHNQISFASSLIWDSLSPRLLVLTFEETQAWKMKKMVVPTRIAEP